MGKRTQQCLAEGLCPPLGGLPDPLAGQDGSVPVALTLPVETPRADTVSTRRARGISAAIGAGAGVVARSIRSRTIFEATRTPMPSARPTFFGSMAKVYQPEDSDCSAASSQVR